jgi:hypothetical protein
LKYAGAGIVSVGAAIGGAAYYFGQTAKLSEAVSTTIATVSESTTSYYPPAIAGLTYTPTRVVNSKIYEIRVDVEISNAAGRLFPIQVSLKPVVYAQLPVEAFPKEQTKTTTLSTTGLKSEALSTSFANLVGGREYDLKATITNTAGAIDERTVRTQYVREFENFAALNGEYVIATYCPRYNPNDPWFELWTDPALWYSLGYKSRPLLGGYSSRDPIVIAKHVDWASGHGIDAFAVSWGFGDENGGWGDTTFKDSILAHPMSNQIKWSILYEDINARLPTEVDEHGVKVVNFDNPDVGAKLLRDFNYLVETYFKNASYFRIDNRIVVYFDGSRFWRGSLGSVGKVIDEVRQAMRAKGYELYLISSQLGDWIPYTLTKAFDGQIQREVITSLDAVSTDSIWILNAWNPDAKDFIPYVDRLYNDWLNKMNDMKRDIIPNMTPGWEAHPWKGSYANVTKDSFLPRDPARFGQLIQLSRQYSTRHAYLIGSFNNVWFESTQVEPDTQDGFTYLNMLSGLS